MPTCQGSVWFAGMAELKEQSSSARDTARREMPSSVRDEVRTVGEVLGQVIAEHAGTSLLDDVEALRRRVIRARTDGDLRGRHAEAADLLVSSWSLDRAELVARAFTCYFHLVNLVEERFRARALREPDQVTEAPPDALAAAIATVRTELGDAGLDELLANAASVTGVHGSSHRGAATSCHLRRCDELVSSSSVSATRGTSDAEHGDARRRLLEAVDALWRTAQLRSQELQPLDEVRALMGVFDETLFRLVPDLYRVLNAALGSTEERALPALAPPFLRFGSWVGGDRDGNPHITARVTLETMLIQSEHILRGLHAAATRIGRSLTADSVTTPPDPRLLARLRATRAIAAAREPRSKRGHPGNRIGRCSCSLRSASKDTLRGDLPLAYAGSDELLDDLRCVQESLVVAGAPRQAFGDLQDLVWQAQTFGFYLADLEIRQHSDRAPRRACGTRGRRHTLAGDRRGARDPAHGGVAATAFRCGASAIATW